MTLLRNYPFIKLLSFQLAGIGLAVFFPGAGKFILPVPAVLWLWLLFRRHKQHFSHDLLHSASLAMAVLYLSFINTLLNRQETITPGNGMQNYIARILSSPVEKPKSIQITVRLLESDTPALSGRKMLVYLEKNSQSENMQAGDVLLANSKLSYISNRGNPFEFNYRAYMHQRQIDYRSYVPGKYFRIYNDPSPPLIYAAQRLQHKLAGKLKQHIKQPEAFQVVSALSLGYREELEPKTRTYFTDTGSMHILAVSGLHVGMIFLFLDRILSPVKKSRSGRSFYLLLLLAVLWGYSLLTGFSPSVQRAVVMFSFILLGKSLNRQVPVYNSLAASAFLLLILNPGLLFEVGFQLSYMAVISIVFFYPRLDRLIPFSHALLKAPAQLVLVSLAAQAGIFSLSIFYFHRFPLYFWLSNLIVVPAAYLLLGLTILFFMAEPFPGLMQGIACLLGKLTGFCLRLLKTIGSWPMAVQNNISINSFQLICMLVALFLLMCFIASRNRGTFTAFLAMLVAFQVSRLNGKIHRLNQQKIIVYRSSTPVIHLIRGRTNYLLSPPGQPPPSYLYTGTVLKLQLAPPVFLYVSDADTISDSGIRISYPLILFSGHILILGNNMPFADRLTSVQILYPPVLLKLDGISHKPAHYLIPGFRQEGFAGHSR
ncbi:MAG: ComEC/Rec2 family competence protein [Mangrovibacterium sp.]